MRYQEIIKTVANVNNTAEDEVDKEIRLAIKSAGLQMEPEEFIETVSIITRINNCNKKDR